MTQRSEDLTSIPVLEGIFHSIPIMLAVLDNNLKYIFVSQQYLDFIKVDSEQVHNRTVAQALPEPVYLSIAPLLERALSGESISFEVALPTTPESFLNIQYQPRFNADGDQIGILMSGVDISELKSAELDLKELNNHLEDVVHERTQSLEQANAGLIDTLDTLKHAQSSLVESEKMASLGSLVAGIAHEVNTPLGISITATSYLEENIKSLQAGFESGSLTKTQFLKTINGLKESANILNSNLNRAESLISSFKQVAVEQSDQQLQAFNLKEIVDNLLVSLSHEIRISGVSVDVDCSDSIELESYSSGYIQVLTNLITNSLRHGFDDWNGEKKISFKIKADERQIKIEYSDSGKGIASSVIDRIFEPFVTTKRGQGGSGLGTNIIYNTVVQLLKGRIECHSEPNFGARFTLILPRTLF
ncbi:ATP-binding protein [Vibrio tapetis subsp. quintayensis]|uniref:ATP-binding protein n=1 Tax=Vibrio tapetis TaxID=52443 RepID=UPI0025B53B79|nr:ATP-binding protein [Vibrio tapetis]MDN3678987.1 ATP-binding protein [Vibrio tapetis subsp. quintayensis]